MAVVCVAVLVGIVLGVFRYFKFVSKTVYEESVSHLTEVFHQSDNMMRELTDKNLTYLHIWGENLQNILSEDEICDYIKKAQEDAGFLEFFFLSADGDYKMATGETGYLGLQENMEEEIRQGNDVIAKAHLRQIQCFQGVAKNLIIKYNSCLLYTSPSPRDRQKSRMPSSA